VPEDQNPTYEEILAYIDSHGVRDRDGGYTVRESRTLFEMMGILAPLRRQPSTSKPKEIASVIYTPKPNTAEYQAELAWRLSGPAKERTDGNWYHYFSSEAMRHLQLAANRQFKEHLEFLAKQESWRLSELPESVANERVLRSLDVKGWIEVRTWFMQNVTTDPSDPKPCTPVPSLLGWFSLSKNTSRAGGWEKIIGKSKCDPDCAAEIRLTELGKFELDEIRENQTPAIPQHSGARRKSGPKRHSRRGKAKELTPKQKMVVVMHEINHQSFVEIAALWKCRPQAVQQLFQRAIKNPGYKGSRSVNLSKSKRLNGNIRSSSGRTESE